VSIDKLSIREHQRTWNYRFVNINIMFNTSIFNTVTAARIKQLGSQWTGCHNILHEYFSKSVRRVVWQEYPVLNVKGGVHLWYLDEFFLQCETFPINVLEKIKTCILYSSLFFFGISCRFWHNVKDTVQPDRPNVTIIMLRINDALCLPND
jgi:hypothetical protein